MKKSLVIANAILLVLILMFDVGYMLTHELLIKSIASMLFVTTGIINLTYCIKNKTNLKFPIWMIIALIFAMLGDILLVLNFYLGAAAFAVGHIFYFVSYCMLEKMNRKDFLYGTAISIFALCIIFLTPFLDFGNIFMQGVCSIYAIIISFMVGKAVSNLSSKKNAVNIIITIGSILFIFSDAMLMLDLFGSIPVAAYLCLCTYYPAQFLLALSVLIYGSTYSLIYQNT